MGVWIETTAANSTRFAEKVTPFVGVWIETTAALIYCFITSVTPFVGVWIETAGDTIVLMGNRSHTLRGCVD